MSCIFCKIVAGEIPARMVTENEHVVAFHDLNPVAPTHVLVIPRKHLVSVHDASPDDQAMLGSLMLTAQQVAEMSGLGPEGYRLVVNTGKNGGQSVFHLHLHVIGGRPMAWPPG